MNLTLTTKITLYFLLLVVVTASNFLILLNTEKKINEQHKWVLHTHKVVEESERFLGYLRDAETGQRGFLLTKNESYLEPFNVAIQQAMSTYTILKKLTENNETQQNRLLRVYDLMINKTSELIETIELFKSKK